MPEDDAPPCEKSFAAKSRQLPTHKLYSSFDSYYEKITPFPAPHSRHHYSRSRSALTLYIGGVSAGTATDNCTGPTTNTSLLYIGRRGNGINYFKGDVDEVRIRSVALTQAQIQNDMFCKLNSVTNLAAAYNFNEGVPNRNNVLLTQVNNVTGSNHGTLNNLTKTGNASNFVTGQVRYVKADATGSNNGSSWATTRRTVLFNAPNSILLQPGFEAKGMQSFKAQIGPNVTCVN